MSEQVKKYIHDVRASLKNHPAILKMTPVAVSFLTTMSFTSNSPDTQSEKGAAVFLYDNGLIDIQCLAEVRTHAGLQPQIAFDITEKGRCLVRHWVNSPLPVESWKMPEED